MKDRQIIGLVESADYERFERLCKQTGRTISGGLRVLVRNCRTADDLRLRPEEPLSKMNQLNGTWPPPA